MEVATVLSLVIFAVCFCRSFRLAAEYERYVHQRMGRYLGVRGPGIFFVLPFFEQTFKFDLRLKALRLPEIQALTADNVSVKVVTVCMFETVDAKVAGGDYSWRISQDAQQVIAKTIAECDLDTLLVHRDEIETRLTRRLAEDYKSRGVNVHSVGMMAIQLPEQLRDVFFKQAVAERERRWKVVSAEGELESAAKLADAAAILETVPEALRLRYLQTMNTLAKEGQSFLVFPIAYETVDPHEQAQ